MACGNGGASEPPVTSYDPAATSKMQFAVGVATIASNGGQSVAYGLNVVETLRQSNGLSGVLYSQPQDASARRASTCSSPRKPVTKCSPPARDFGTNHITWGTLNQSQWTGPPRGQKRFDHRGVRVRLVPVQLRFGAAQRRHAAVPSLQSARLRR